jgi:hypothetical protein
MQNGFTVTPLGKKPKEGVSPTLSLGFFYFFPAKPEADEKREFVVLGILS